MSKVHNEQFSQKDLMKSLLEAAFHAATRDDIAAARADLKQEIADSRSELKQENESLKEEVKKLNAKMDKLLWAICGTIIVSAISVIFKDVLITALTL